MLLLYNPAPACSPDDLHLVHSVLRGDESSFTTLVDRYHGSLIRLALTFVSDASVAEEVVQDTWIGVLEGLQKFEGRSSLKTWVFRILTNKAKTRGVREGRHVSFSAMTDASDDSNEPAVDPARWNTSGHWTGYWASYPQSWDDDTPEKVLLSKEAGQYLENAINALPQHYRQVMVMRDVEGMTSKEVSVMLEISEVHQRVSLHRARSKIRQALEQYIERGTKPT